MFQLFVVTFLATFTFMGAGVLLLSYFGFAPKPNWMLRKLENKMNYVECVRCGWCGWWAHYSHMKNGACPQCGGKVKSLD